MKIPRIQLVLIATLFWTIAGFNVARIGLITWNTSGGNTTLKIIATLIVFLLFAGIIFRKMYIRYTRRFIESERLDSLFQILDRRGWIIILFMIALGITVRVGMLVPVFYISFFYTGLGSALFLTGLRFAYFLHRHREVLRNR